MPEELETVLIKFIYKEKGKKDEMKNQRGIFITSIITKLFEKIIRNRNKEKLQENISIYQNGALEKMGTRDNIMVVQAVIDYNKNMEGELFLLIADAETCFDKLLLEDCGNELYRIGFPVNEIEAIEEMNRNITAEIETPFGRTENIKIERAVKQGSVMGPTMCIVETDRVNDINEKTITTIGAETEIESVIFVDDIMGMGTKSTIEKVGRNMREMEIKKKFTFSKEKTKIIKIETKKRKRTEEEDIPVVTVKKGRIEKTDKEKYLGEWINSKGDNKIKIEKKKEKIPFMIQQIRKLQKSREDGYGSQNECTR